MRGQLARPVLRGARASNGSRPLDRIRKLEPKTQSGYIRAVRDFTVWFGRSPDRAAPEDLRLFQLHLPKARAL